MALGDDWCPTQTPAPYISLRELHAILHRFGLSHSPATQLIRTLIVAIAGLASLSCGSSHAILVISAPATVVAGSPFTATVTAMYNGEQGHGDRRTYTLHHLRCSRGSSHALRIYRGRRRFPYLYRPHVSDSRQSDHDGVRLRCDSDSRDCEHHGLCPGQLTGSLGLSASLSIRQLAAVAFVLSNYMNLDVHRKGFTGRRVDNSVALHDRIPANSHDGRWFRFGSAWTRSDPKRNTRLTPLSVGRACLAIFGYHEGTP